MSGIPFGRYQLIKRLARGGMAEVFLANQSGPEGFHRLVAIKRILPHLVDSADFVRMFLDEARLAAHLSHPNVVHIYEFGKVDEHYFIAMEYVPSVHAGILIKHAETERMPDVLIARIGADACAGLHYAHELRDVEGRALHAVHRDVSPPNLLVSYDGAVKLVDFGIAKAVSSIEQTRPGVVKGKFAYMSPEQTTGNKLDGRSDVFALAIVLWELLAGKLLVPRQSPVDGMRMIRDGRLEPIEKARPDIPKALAAAINSALEVDRDHRCSALELGQALEGFIKESKGGIGSSMELADWIRSRFPRENTSSAYPALRDEPAGTRQATSATRAGEPQSTRISPPETGQASAVAEPAKSAAGAFSTRVSGEDSDAFAHLTTNPPTTSHAAISSHPTTGNETSAHYLTLDEAPTQWARPRSRGGGQVAAPLDSAQSDSIIVASDLLERESDEKTLDDGARGLIASAEAETILAGGFSPEMSTSEGAKTDPFHRESIETILAPPSGDPAATIIEPPSQTQMGGDYTIAEPDRTANDLSQLLGPPGDFAFQTTTRPRISARARATRVVALVAGGAIVGLVSAVLLSAEGKSVDQQAIHPAPQPTQAIALDSSVAAIETIDAALPVQTSTLEVATRPRGAMIALSGRSPVESPARFEDLEPGSYQLTIEHDGFAVVEREVTVTAGERRSLELDLVEEKPAPETADAAEPPSKAEPRQRRRDRRKAVRTKGTVKLRTRPYSEVFLGKRKLGQTPLVTELDQGKHTLTFLHPGKKPVRKTVTVKSGDTAKIDFALP